MTAWQDLPPQTRRQARMRERGENPTPAVDGAPGSGHPAGTPPEAVRVVPPQPVAEQFLPQTQEQSFRGLADREEFSAAYGRRARRSAEAPPVSLAPEPPQAAPAPEYRVRDFSPEDARFSGGFSHTVQTPAPAQPSAFQVEPVQAAPQWTPPAPRADGDLSYYTQAGSPPSPPAPPPVVSSVPTAFAAPPRPLTRRQLRELEASQGLRPAADDSVALAATAPPVPVGPVMGLPSPEPAMAPVPLEPEGFTDASAAPTPPRAAPVPVPVPVPVSVAKPVAEAATGSRGVDQAPEIFATPAESWAPQQEPAAAEGSAFVRTIGSPSGALTTSALVIPAIPQSADITRPFSSTGEILVTGSIDLPHTLSSTGAHPARFDHADIDALFAQEDHDYTPADSAPVRAIRAVSTHTSTHGVISAKKPASNKMPVTMMVTAGILAVSVAALFAAALIFGYL